jgi:virginiamycin B lyase
MRRLLVLWLVFAASLAGDATTLLAKAPPPAIIEYAVPNAPSFIATGPDGSLWFTEFSSGKIGRISTSGVVMEFVIPTSASVPIGITSGPDGNLWFTEQFAHQIGRLRLRS